MAACVQDPGRLRDLAERIRARALSPVDLVQNYLDRIEVVQPLVEPWRQVDAERALATADERARQAADGQFLGPLHGLPFGVKDIIDVEGLPTRCNCRALEDCAPAAADAEVVLALKAAGAIVLGKLHTTEFAYFDPSPARNPYNPAHTPGGSSSGSGAGVAAGTVPMGAWNADAGLAQSAGGLLRHRRVQAEHPVDQRIWCAPPRALLRYRWLLRLVRR